MRLGELMRLNGTTGGCRNSRQIERGNDASGQMRKHLALQAVVIDGVRRAARDVGGIAVVMYAGSLTRTGRSTLVRYVAVVRHQLHRDPRQGPERWPYQCDQRTPRHPGTPATAKRHALV